MKRFAGFITFAMLLVFWSTDASAWYCRATSRTGSWGWGRSYSLYEARAIALNQCAIRTPRGYTCFLRTCY